MESLYLYYQQLRWRTSGRCLPPGACRRTWSELGWRVVSASSRALAHSASEQAEPRGKAYQLGTLPDRFAQRRAELSGTRGRRGGARARPRGERLQWLCERTFLYLEQERSKTPGDRDACSSDLV